LLTAALVVAMARINSFTDSSSHLAPVGLERQASSCASSPPDRTDQLDRLEQPSFPLALAPCHDARRLQELTLSREHGVVFAPGPPAFTAGDQQQLARALELLRAAFPLGH
jgi:hypothetical protein